MGAHGREPGRSTALDRLVEDGLGLVEATDLQESLSVVGQELESSYVVLW